MLDDKIRKISSVEGESAGGMRYLKQFHKSSEGVAAVNGDEERGRSLSSS